jgi:hypothetical protein
VPKTQKSMLLGKMAKYSLAVYDRLLLLIISPIPFPPP